MAFIANPFTAQAVFLQLIHSFSFSLLFPRIPTYYAAWQSRKRHLPKQHSFWSGKLEKNFSPFMQTQNIQPPAAANVTQCSPGTGAREEGQGAHGEPESSVKTEPRTLHSSPGLRKGWVPSQTHLPSLYRSHHTSSSTMFEWEAEASSSPKIPSTDLWSLKSQSKCKVVA